MIEEQRIAKLEYIGSKNKQFDREEKSEFDP
jgi:hypothetical protein